MKKLFAGASALTIVIMMSTAVPSLAQANHTSVTTGKVTIQPYEAQGCIGDTCMFLSTPLSGTVYVQGWAFNTGFYGYFRLTAPSGTYYSATQTWLGEKGNYAQWSGVLAIVGQYCVSGFTSAGADKGTVCKNVQ